MVIPSIGNGPTGDALVRDLLVTGDLVIRRQRDAIQDLFEQQDVLRLRDDEVVIHYLAEIERLHGAVTALGDAL